MGVIFILLLSMAEAPVVCACTARFLVIGFLTARSQGVRSGNTDKHNMGFDEHISRLSGWIVAMNDCIA
jgi:hypothetical protein